MGCENARFLGAERAQPDDVDTEQLEMVEVVRIPPRSPPPSPSPAKLG
jgi:hypothetical protein